MLAVENECGFVNIKVILTVVASVLEDFNQSLLVVDSMIVVRDVLCILVNIILVFCYSVIVGGNAVFKSLHVYLKLNHGKAHCFQCHHNFGLCLEGTFVLISIEDWVTHFKGCDSIIESVATGARSSA